MFVTNPREQKLYIEAKDSLGFTDLTIGAGEVNPLYMQILSIVFVS